MPILELIWRKDDSYGVECDRGVTQQWNSFIALRYFLIVEIGYPTPTIYRRLKGGLLCLIICRYFSPCQWEAERDQAGRKGERSVQVTSRDPSIQSSPPRSHLWTLQWINLPVYIIPHDWIFLQSFHLWVHEDLRGWLDISHKNW